jgi:hypothetical protein
MKELKIMTNEYGRHCTEAAQAEYDKVFLQVNGCGKYAVELSVEGEVFSPHLRLNSERGSQACSFEVLAGTYYRVVAIAGTMERVVALESGEQQGEGDGSPDYDFGDASIDQGRSEIEDF